MGSSHPPPQDRASVVAGDRVADRYVLVRPLAEGGMGRVWVARDEKLGREVAVKVMHRAAGMLSDAQERFEREARAAAALRTSHVVAVYDYGAHGDLPFIAMELLEGESLGDRLHRAGRLPVGEVSQLLRQIAKGLKAAHKAGLVHRDLKPSNIFLATRDDGDEIVKLLDFGIVKAGVDTPSDATKSGVMLGTPQYMAPEQARGNRTVDHRADLWSMAVIAYEMLTGENPFWRHTETMADIFVRLCVEPIPPPSSLLPDGEVDDFELDPFFETALARDPFDRFQTVEELLEAFALTAGLSLTGLDDLSIEASFPGWSKSARPRTLANGLSPTLGDEGDDVIGVAHTLTNDDLGEEQLGGGAEPESPGRPASTLTNDDIGEEQLDLEASSDDDSSDELAGHEASPDVEAASVREEDPRASDAAFYGDDLLEELSSSSGDGVEIDEASSMTTSVVPRKRPARLMGAALCVAAGVGLGLHTLRDAPAPPPTTEPAAAIEAPDEEPSSTPATPPLAGEVPSAKPGLAPAPSASGSASAAAPVANEKPPKPLPVAGPPPGGPKTPDPSPPTDADGGGPPTWYRSP